MCQKNPAPKLVAPADAGTDSAGRRPNPTTSQPSPSLPDPCPSRGLLLCVLRRHYGLPYFRFSIGTASIRSVPLRTAGRTCRRESPRAPCCARATGSLTFDSASEPLLNASCRSERSGGLAGASRRAPRAAHVLRAPAPTKKGRAVPGQFSRISVLTGDQSRLTSKL